MLVMGNRSSLYDAQVEFIGIESRANYSEGAVLRKIGELEPERISNAKWVSISLCKLQVSMSR